MLETNHYITLLVLQGEIPDALKQPRAVEFALPTRHVICSSLLFDKYGDMAKMKKCAFLTRLLACLRNMMDGSVLINALVELL